MEVDRIRECKKIAEDGIADIIAEFEKQTTTIVSGLSISAYTETGINYTRLITSYDLEVKL